MTAVEAADGIVIVDGKRMIRREVARSIVEAIMAELFAELRERLTSAIAGGPGTEEQLVTELEKSERKMKEYIAEMLPVLN
jgi:ribose 5-phosphate isomerase RpiB